MRTLLAGLCLWALCLGFSSCSTTFRMDREEWDSLAGFTPDGEDPIDPTELYQLEPLRRSLLLRSLYWTGFDRIIEAVFFMDTAPSRVENPAGLAREDFVGMSQKMGGSLDLTAEVSVRLLWIYEYDLFHVLNQVEALSAAIRILERDGVDPMTMPMPEIDRKSALRLAERDLGIIQALWPAERKVDLSDDDRARYTAALKSLTRAPFMPLSVQRRLIAKLHEAWNLEGDTVLAVATEAALRRAIHHGLTGALYLGRIQRETALRIATVRGFNRLSGPKAVAFCLAFFGNRSPESGALWHWDESTEAERRLLIELAGQLRAPQIYEPYEIDTGSKLARGPKPIEFLYDRVRRESSEGLRLIALEAMAHCLAHQVEQETDWADAWWLEYSLKDSAADSDSTAAGR